MYLMDIALDATPNISIITEIELLCWKTDIKMEQHIKNFIYDSIILGINPNIVAQCVLLRKNKKIKTPDAIIAATALVYDYTLITNNEKDFINIDNLKIINPYKI